MIPVPDSQPDSPEARRYNRFRRWLGASDLIVGFVLLITLLATGGTAGLRDLALVLTGQNYTLAVFAYVFLLSLMAKLFSLPIDFYAFRLEREYNLSNQKRRSWLWDEVKGWLVGLLVMTILVEILYAIIRAFPQHWWIVMWLVFIAFVVLVAQLAPIVFFPIFYRFRPLENDALRDRLLKLTDKAKTRVRGVYEWKVSEKSNKANAALTGLGNTRRIILADTLLANYTDDEIEAVLAHELGHHVHSHIAKGLALQSAITFFGFWATDRVLHYSIDEWQMFQDMHDFANLPLLALIASVLGLLLAPMLNAYSRFNERQADRYAWKSISSIDPFVTSMRKLAAQNLAEQHPPAWIEFLFHSHPSISRRIAAARAWSNKNG